LQPVGKKARLHFGGRQAAVASPSVPFPAAALRLLTRLASGGRAFTEALGVVAANKEVGQS